MAKNLLKTALTVGAAAAAPAAIGALAPGGALGAGGIGGAFGSADMLAGGAAGGLLPGAAATAAVPGSIETAGLLDMGAGNMVNPEYFVGESMGMPLYAGSPDAPFAERAGNVLSSFGDTLQSQDPLKAMKMMNMGQPQQQQVSRPPAIQRPQDQPQTQVQSPYGQTNGFQLTDEHKRALLARMGGQYGLIG